MKERIVAFLTAIDAAHAVSVPDATLDVYHIDRSAMVWEYDYTATTSDIDILCPKGAADLVALAVNQFGRGTEGARAHGLYLDVVNEAFPPMPGGYEGRAHQVEGLWRVRKVYHLNPHDLAASKLRRFAPKDRADIRQLCDWGYLDPAKLEEILEKAYRFMLEKDGSEFRDNAFEHLRVV